MSHCHHEHHEHGGHDHSHHEHDHTDDVTPALEKSLYQQIDFDSITTLNEKTPNSGRSICKKTWAQRLEHAPELSSDTDEQLLMHIPYAESLLISISQTDGQSFTAQVKLHSILIRTPPAPSAPLTLKLFVNRDDLDFGTASDMQPAQTLCLSQTTEVQEVPVKRALFNTVSSLDLFFVDNWSQGEEDSTTVEYLGFKGEWMHLNRGPVDVMYEAAANPSDHRLAAGVRGELGSRLGGAGRRDGV